MDPAMTPRSRAWTATVAACCLSALVSLGFSVAAVLLDGPGRVNAGYALTRSTALVAAALSLWWWRSRPAALAVALAVTLMQAGDAVVGALVGDAMKTWGPAGLAVLTGGCAVWLARFPLRP